MLHTLSGTRIELRPIETIDDEVLCVLWNSPEVRRFLFDDQLIAIDRARELVSETRSLAPLGLGMWTIRLRPALTILGCAALLPVGAVAEFAPELEGQVEVLVALAPASWGKGLATEALGLLADHAFGTLGLAQLVGIHDAPNTASARMLVRAGFEATGACPGPRHTLVLYRLRAADEFGSRST